MWQGIYGHDLVAEHFRRSLDCGRLASSFLFLGPEGVGKRSFALQLAKSLLCTSSADSPLSSCGDCESCHLATADTHPDIDLVRLPSGKRWLSVDLFLGDRAHRNQEGLCHNISLRPLLGKRRIAIIDDADFLTPESANCLLKTLEEPPPGAILILIGTSRSRQLPTVLSRTQIVQFQALPTELVRQLLLEKNLVDNEEEAERIAGASNGSLQHAQDLVEMAMQDFRPRLLEQLSNEPLQASLLARTITDFATEGSSEAEARRKRLRAVFGLACQHYRGLMRGSASQSPSNRELTDRFLQVLQCCHDAQDELYRNANQATLVEAWVDDLTRILCST